MPFQKQLGGRKEVYSFEVFFLSGDEFNGIEREEEIFEDETLVLATNSECFWRNYYNCYLIACAGSLCHGFNP